jgi:hypothetical protein
LAQARALANRSGTRAPNVQPASSDTEVVDHLARLLHVTNDALLRTASDNLTWVLDEVRDPGAYLGAPGSSIADMIEAAGGVQQSADLSAIEVTSTLVDQRSGITRTSRTNYAGRDNRTALVPVQPLDVIRLRPVYSEREEGTVTVAGQVRYPVSSTPPAANIYPLCSNAPAAFRKSPIPMARSLRVAMPRLQSGRATSVQRANWKMKYPP